VRRVLDLCTGSGCLAVLAALAFPRTTIDALDRSAGALALARRTVASHRLADRIAVMYLGRLCEIGPTERVFGRPAHPYTALLLEAIPLPDPTIVPAANVAVGEPPSPIDPPSGCRFRTRCPRADALCAEKVPALRPTAGGHMVACHHPLTGR
jgi:peptide/nickel transport system ATP-binding protein